MSTRQELENQLIELKRLSETKELSEKDQKNLARDIEKTEKALTALDKATIKELQKRREQDKEIKRARNQMVEDSPSNQAVRAYAMRMLTNAERVDAYARATELLQKYKPYMEGQQEIKNEKARVSYSIPKRLLPEVDLAEVAEMYELGIFSDPRACMPFGTSLNEVKEIIMTRDIIKKQVAGWKLGKDQMKDELEELERLARTRPLKQVVVGGEYVETDDFKATKEKIDQIHAKFDRQLRGYYALHKDNRAFSQWYEEKIERMIESDESDDGSFPKYIKEREARESYPESLAVVDFGNSFFGKDKRWLRYKECWRTANRWKEHWKRKYRKEQ